jgi:predicted ArsR family transcriptional regulator
VLTCVDFTREQTTAELSGRLGITWVNTRNHLMALEKVGLVRAIAARPTRWVRA